ncbi:hypothetical protein FHR84_002604 [Actinopolyspora biskrensis]|uniref:Uncharacterized protein n=1 Tax=Actinopolyspora biskrensis TaxID=1470178 RepID=A0A852YZ37_9ACTN|nr:hypothetical protein [Actinopolyspora biskrensis]NYH79270.1 hypothetical protein [Actinopolyspora biskrensis]
MISAENPAVRYRKQVSDALRRARELRTELDRLERRLQAVAPEVATWLPFAVTDQEAVVHRLWGVLDDIDNQESY